MSDKVLRIGVTAGVNPTAAAVMKAELLGVAARAGVRIEVLSTDEELRQDAADKKTMEADRRIAALRQTWALQAMGCDEVIVPDVRIDPVRRELQAELEVPVVPVYDGLVALGPDRRPGLCGERRLRALACGRRVYRRADARARHGSLPPTAERRNGASPSGNDGRAP